MSSHPFRFRADEAEELRQHLGSIGWLVLPGEETDLLLRLRAAGLVEACPVLEVWVGYFLTPWGKAVISKALG